MYITLVVTDPPQGTSVAHPKPTTPSNSLKKSGTDDGCNPRHEAAEAYMATQILTVSEYTRDALGASRAASPVQPRAARNLLPVVWHAAAIVLLPLALFLYATSFNDLPIIERKHSVLGDADASNYALLLRNFELDKKMGNEWNAHHRSIGDNAQKHKLHHIDYAIVGSAIYRIAAPLYERLGMPRGDALYAVNAIISIINMLLLALLLKGSKREGNSILPFVIFYAVTLSTWVFSSVPESWPFSATLVMLFMLALRRRPIRPVLLGCFLGVIMLNNIFMAALAVLAWWQIAGEKTSAVNRLKRSAVVCAVAGVTWVGSLFVLSRYDSSFRPDNFVRYTIWFKQFTGLDLPRTDPYVWKSAGTNLFVNSIASNQPDPSLPQEALQTTLQGSTLGLFTTAAYLLLFLVAAITFGARAVQSLRGGGFRSLVTLSSTDAALWCVTMLCVTVVLFYASGFLYSAVVLPALMIFLASNLDLRSRWQQLLFYATLLLIVINNAAQIAAFHKALAVMS